ncbi:unnamed protein product [Boreogadus saida]
MPAERHQAHLLLLLSVVWSGILCRDADPVSASLPLPSGDNASSSIPPPNTTYPGHRSAEPGSPPQPEARFALKALLRDLSTRRPLPGATLDVYAGRALRASARAGAAGEALLWLPYGPRLRLTLLARAEGYVPATLPWETARRPLFSAVTLGLLPQNHGNIWLFDDSLVITAKLPDSSSQPSVKFPKDLLTLAGNASVSSLSAYLTVPVHHLARDCADCTPAIVGNQSAYRNTELRPTAALSVRLCSGADELQVRGPIHLSLPLGHNTGLRPADTLPAWAFSSQTGAWEQQGLGIVQRVDGHLVWTYTASHLGYWIAAPLPTDHRGLAGSIDFLSDHNFLLVGLFGATVAVIVGFLTVLVCHCGGSRRAPRRRRRGRRRARFSKLTVLKKDQTTSTHMMEEGLSFQSGERGGGGRPPHHGVPCDPSSTPRHMANYNIYVEDPGLRSAAPHHYQNLASSDRSKGAHHAQSHYVNGDQAARLQETSDHQKPDLFFQDKLVHLYNQPVAIVQATELFGCPEPKGSAAFPRNGGEHDPNLDPARKGGHQTESADDPRQPDQDDPQPLQTPPQGQGPDANVWGLYNNKNNLLESSVSVPGTLSEEAAAGMGAPGELQGVSERTLLELGSGKASAVLPRAWFVSLEGRPAARVRHSIIELSGGHHRRRPTSSNDTSLDSGVDMTEALPRRSVRASSLPHRTRAARYSEEPDLSSSESGTTATCTPEDPSLRNILDGSVGAIPNIPEESASSAQEDSESRETPPPPRRLRKVREKGGTEKRSAKQGHRPMSKPS